MVKRELNEVIKKMFYDGLVDEYFVMKSIEDTFGGKCTKADSYEDRNLHIDFWWDSPKKGKIGIDVKGVKKNKRNDDKKTDEIHWIEIQNVNGKKGWLYGGADYIAFMTFNKILFCKINKLQNFIEEKIKDKQLVFSNPQECYIPYQRYKRKDIIVKVLTEDLLNITDFYIEIL